MTINYGKDDTPAAAGIQYGANDKPADAKPTGAIRKLADLATGFASGAIGATKSVSDAAGAGNAVSGALDTADKFIQSGLSDQAVSDQQERQAILKESQGKGIYEGLKSAGRAFAVAPVQATVTGLGSAIPTIAAGIATGGASVPVSLGAMAAMGAAQGAGSIKGGIYDDIKQRSADAKMDPVAAEAAAIKAQEYGGPNTEQIALGAALGLGDSVTGVSKVATSMIRKGMGKGAQEIAQGSTRGIIARTALGAAGEVPLEAAQGGQQQYASNVASQREGFAVSPWDNVVSQGAFEGLASAGPGAAFGALHGKAAPAPGQDPQAPITPSAPGTPAPEPTPPGLGFNPTAGTTTVFPDGTTILNSESANGEQDVFDKRFALQAASPQDQAVPTDSAAPIQPAAEQPNLMAAAQTEAEANIERTRAAWAEADRVRANRIAKIGVADAPPNSPLTSAAFMAVDSGAHDAAIAQQNQALAQAGQAQPATENVAASPLATAAESVQPPANDPVAQAPAAAPTPQERLAKINSEIESGLNADTGAKLNPFQIGIRKAQSNQIISQLPKESPYVPQPENDGTKASPAPGAQGAAQAGQVATGVQAASLSRLRQDAQGMLLGDVPPDQRQQVRSQVDADLDSAVRGGIAEEDIFNALHAGPEQLASLAAPFSASNEVPAQAEPAQAATESVAPSDSFAALKNRAYKTAGPMFGKDIYSAGVQNDWQKLLDAMDGSDSAKLQALSDKYRKDEELDGMGTGTSGAGPGRVNQAKAGAAQLARFARLGVNALKQKSAPSTTAPQPQGPQNEPQANQAIAQPPKPEASADSMAGAASEVESKRPANWQANRLAAGKVAKDLGINPAGMALSDVVAAVQQADTAASGPVQLGRNNTPLSEGGKPKAPASSPANTASWVIREKDTGKVVMETFDKKKVDALNTQKYEAVPIAQHLSEQSQPAASEAPAPAPADTNKFFTKDAADKARAFLKSRSGSLNSGLDPEMMLAGITLAGYHIEKGARTFAAYAKEMLADLGDEYKPYLKSWYLAVAFDPKAKTFASDMTPADEVARLDVDAPMSVARTTGRVVEVKVADLVLSRDVPQFKSDAGANGVTQAARLEGKYDRRLAAPIQVWERLDGRREVVSGRHRLDLAQRSGETTIPAQINREEDGFTADAARMLDIELNIKDGRGKVKDYVNYFKEFKLTSEQARQAGLLNTAIGRQAYTISDAGSPTLISAHSNGAITDEAAVGIAQNAPGNEALQSLGIQHVTDGKSINFAVNVMRAAQAAGFEGGSSSDMFGFDDSFAKEAEAIAKQASSQQHAIRQQLAAIRGASKRPELAAQGGVDVKSPKITQARIAKLEAQLNALDGFSTNPEIYRQLRIDAGLAPQGEAAPVQPAAIELQEPEVQDDAPPEDFGGLFDEAAASPAPTGDAQRAPAPGEEPGLITEKIGEFNDAKLRPATSGVFELEEGGFEKFDGIWYRGESTPSKALKAEMPSGHLRPSERLPFQQWKRVADFSLDAWGSPRALTNQKKYATPDTLTAPSQQDILDKQAREEAATKAEAKASADAASKAKADAELGEFTLTGSDRAADVGVASGQGGIFDDAPAPKAAKPTVNGYGEAFTVDINSMFAGVPYRASTPVQVGKGEEVLSTEIIPAKTKVAKRDQDDYGLPDTVYAWRVSAVKSEDGGVYSQIEAMTNDSGRTPQQEVIATFTKMEGQAFDAVNRIAPAIGKAAVNAYEQASAAQAPGMFDEPAPAPKSEAKPAAQAKPATPITKQTFDQWVKDSFARNEYRDDYLTEFDGNEKLAMLGGAIGSTDSTQRPAELLKLARQAHFDALMDQPREAKLSMEVFDSLNPTQQSEAQRHFYDMDSRLTRRAQDETRAKMDAEAKAKTAEPSVQAAEILDAANITGKERIDALKDVKKGDVTPEELKAAYPAKDAERFSAGSALTKAERKTVLATLVDVYKAKNAPRESKGQYRDGNERFGYAHSPELFEKSDITGAMVRYHVTLPDGKVAHPTELFPDYGQSDIDAEISRREGEETRNKQIARENYLAKSVQFPTKREAADYWNSKSEKSIKTAQGKPTVFDALDREFLTDGKSFAMVPKEVLSDPAMMDAIRSEGWDGLAAQPAAPDYSWAESHAKDTNGEVIPVSEGIVLIRGFSIMTGQAVYTAASKDAGRTRIDIQSFKNSNGTFTPAQMTELLAAREAAARQDEQAFAANPEGPFTGATSNVVASDGMDKRYADYLRTLMASLGMGDKRVFMLHPEDVRGQRDRYKLNGVYHSAMSAGMDSGENGAARVYGPGQKDFYIAIKPGMSEAETIEVIAHELGHVIEKTAYREAVPEVQSAIRQEFEQWLKANKGKSAIQWVEALRNRESAATATAGISPDLSSENLSNYWRSFSEWFADNVSRWATTGEKPLGVVQQFFSDLVKSLRKLVAKVNGKPFVPNKAVADFLNAMGPGAVESLDAPARQPATLNKAHSISRSSALTPAGSLKADAVNSKAPSSVWYYQGDMGSLQFTANVTMNGEPDKGAAAAKALLTQIKAVQTAGWSRKSLRAGSLGTVWVYEKDGKFLTRAGMENAAADVLQRPDMPKSESGYENMVQRQSALASAFGAWLGTLTEAQQANRAVVTRKMNETPVSEWARITDDKTGVNLQYLEPSGQWSIQITAPDFDALLEKVRGMAAVSGAPAAPAATPVTPAGRAMNAATEQLGDRFEATADDMNAVTEALGKDWATAYVGNGAANKRHVASVVADENLKVAPAAKIESRIQSLNKQQEKIEAASAARFDPSRLGGSGAAGRVRDRARAAESAAEIGRQANRLQAELDRRAETVAPSLKYAAASSIDTPAQGVLSNAMSRKEAAFVRLKSLRRQVKDGRSDLRLELIKAETAHKDAIGYVESAHSQIEADANKQGLTTIKPAFSRTPKPAGSMAQDQVQAIADRIAATWANAPEIIVAENMQDPRIPQAARDEDQKQRSLGATGSSEGFFYEGKVYLLADSLTSPSNVVEVLLHESVGHYGMRGVFGDLLTPILQQMATMRKAEVTTKAAQYGLDMSVAEDRLIAAEEVLAEMAVSQPNIGFVQRAIAAIRSWLRKHMPMMSSLKLTDTEIIANIIIPARQFVERGNRAQGRGRASFSHGDADQTDTPAFKAWFGASKIVDADGRPLVVYHGTASSFDVFEIDGPIKNAMRFAITWAGSKIKNELDPSAAGEKRAAFFTNSPDDASVYAASNRRKGTSPTVMPVYLSIKAPLVVDGETGTATTPNGDVIKLDAGATPNALINLAKRSNADGILLRNVHDAFTGSNGVDMFLALDPLQIKSAENNNGNFDPKNPDIRFSRASAIGDTLKGVTVTDLKARAGNKLADYRNLGLQFLGGRQLNDLYAKDIPQLPEYTRMVQQMSADANEVGANADAVATSWGKLKDERALAELMHDATLAQIDAAKPYEPGDNRVQWAGLNARFNALTPDAKKVYTDARDGYKKHFAAVRKAIKEKVERSAMNSAAKAAMLERMDAEFFGSIKGVYFPLARFGQYVVVTRNKIGDVVNVSRAETLNEANTLRDAMRKAYPGASVGKVLKDKEFNAARDSVGRGFLKDLFGVLDKEGVGEELQDAINQLYLASMPDLSWAKHGLHRKGTPGFSQDARRAYAQNMFHGARYLAKLRYADQLQDKLQAMQAHVEAQAGNEAFDSVKGQQIVDEMNKRNDSLMNPKSNPLSTALTSFGFVFHLGLSPASAMVNLSQTALMAYPIMGAKWGFDKAAAALAVAGKQAATNKNDISSALTPDERRAYDAAVNAGTIDVTNAHDLAGIAQGEDSGIMWKVRPIMKWASFLFHHAERFNRQVTFVASYRLARAAGTAHDAAFEQATKATYDGHFDYAASNRPRIMQGNVAKVALLFKQFGQNVVYTISRQAQLAINAETPEGRKEARKALGGILAMHAAGAGVLGLPLVTTLLAAASMLGGSDDEPWDAEAALRNMLAESFGQKPAEVIAKGFSRLTPWDISSRVGLDKLILPDVQEGLEGQRLAESAMAAALGPVAGIGINMLKGMQEMAGGDYARGLESMMPAALRGPIKALRYEQEGAKDKTGIIIKDEVSAAGIAGQALGFGPSEVRNATEGRSAIFAADKHLNKRRTDLMDEYAHAAMKKDDGAIAQARADIAKFNEKNPSRRINGLQMLHSVQGRQKRIDRAKDGIFLAKNHQDARAAGNFSLAE